MTRTRLLVDAIKKGKKVTFFTGAGVSTGAGIPDFRSPGTGLYDNLARLNLPYAEAVFDIDYFKENPKAFYTLASELYPGKFVPTKFHYFIRLVQDKGLLKRVYTQNIDTLERIAGVQDDYIVEAHGSFARNHCVECSEEMSTKELKRQMEQKDVNEGVPTCPKCSGYVKPDIVFFGEGLPSRFFELWLDEAEGVEVAIVAGTSLTVYPFAALPAELEKHSLRVLVNKELVGDFKKKRKTDIVCLQDCDAFAEELCKELGWEEELTKLVEGAKETERNETKESEETTNKDEKKEDEIKKIKETEENKKDKEDRTKKESLLPTEEETETDSDDFVDAVDISKLKI